MNTSQKSRTTHLHIWAAGRRVEQSRDAAFHLETEHHTCREKLVQSLHHFWTHLKYRDNRAVTHIYRFVFFLLLVYLLPVPVHLFIQPSCPPQETGLGHRRLIQDQWVFKMISYSKSLAKILVKKKKYCKVMSLTTPASSRNCIILSSSTRPEKWTLTLWTSLTQSTKRFSR